MMENWILQLGLITHRIVNSCKGYCGGCPFFLYWDMVRYNKPNTQMRYTVRYYNGTTIINDLVTDSYTEAVRREHILRKGWGGDRVWIADRIQEMIVG